MVIASIPWPKKNIAFELYKTPTTLNSKHYYLRVVKLPSRELKLFLNKGRTLTVQMAKLKILEYAWENTNEPTV